MTVGANGATILAEGAKATAEARASADGKAPSVPVPGASLLIEAAAHKVGLDGVRGLAILLVLAFHYVNLFAAPGAGILARAGYAAASAGWIGVDLFFVLSGFLITGILRQTRAKSRYFVNFFARRSLRIFPLYYAFLGAFFLLMPEFPDQGWYWTYLWNVRLGLEGWARGGMLTHFWSLAVEEQFYLLWPLAVYFLADKGLLRLCAAFIAVGLGARLMCFGFGLPAAAYTLMPCHVDALAAGALLTFLPKELNSKQTKNLLLTISGFGALVCCVAALEHGFYNTNFSVVTFGISCVNLFFAGLIALVSRDSAPLLTRAFGSKGMVWLGKYSYGIYVIHYPVAHLFRDLWQTRGGDSGEFGSFAGLCLATTAATLGLAMLSWFCFESRCLRLKRYF